MPGVIIPVSDNDAIEDANLAVNAGVTQLSGVVLAASTALFVNIRAQINGSSITLPYVARPVFFSIVLEASSGNDRYWSHTGNTWVDYGSGLPSDYFDPNEGNWTPSILTSAHLFPSILDSIEVNIPSTPVQGQIRISLYNVVETQNLASEEITGVTYSRVGLSVPSEADSDAQSTKTDAYDETNTTRSRPEVAFWLGDGPTDFHKGRITYSSGTRASGWQAGAYSGGATSGETLDRLHAETILKSRSRALKRLRIPFRLDSGTYWPHQPLLYSGDYYTAVELQHDVAQCVYMIEATEVIAGSPTVTEDTSTTLHLPDITGPWSLAGTTYVGDLGRIPRAPRTSHVSVGVGNVSTIQDAVTALGPNGGTVRIPPGTYTITSSIAIPSNVTVEGAGWDTIIDVNTGNDSYAFYTQKAGEGSRDTSTNISNVTIRNLTLQGRNDTLYFHEHTHLLNINGASDVLVENVQFKNWRGDAIYLGSGNVGYIKYTSTGSGQTLTTATAHNFEDGDEVVIWSTDATRGLSSNVVMVDSTETVPTGLASKTPYYIVNKTSTTFELEASVGGGAITLSGTGTASSGTSGNYVGLQRHNERVTIRNCHFDGGSTDKEHRAMQTAATVTASASTDKITHTGHSYAEGVAIRLNSTGSVPTGLVSGTTYYVRDLETNAYKLSATRAGAAINLTSDGSGTITIPADTVNQRQCISVVDGTAVKIYGNTFTNCGSASMPGVIDIEPDRAPYHIIDDISVTDNTMTDTGGNIGAICANLQHWGDFYQPPRNIKISGNVIRNSVPTGVLVQRSNEALLTDEPLGITIANNHVDTTTGISTGQTGRPFVLSGVSGAVVSGNHFQHTQGGATVGGNATATGDRECLDIMIVNNTFFQCGQIPYASDTGAYDDLYNCGLYIGFVDRLNILGNTFFDCGDEDTGDGECIEFAGGVGSTIIDGNHFVGNGRTDIIVKETGATLGTGTVTASAANDTLTYTAHPYLDGDRFRLATSAADLPAPLEVSTTYFVRDAATNTFKVAATLGGAAINITDAGTGTHTIRPVGWHHYGFNVVRGITGANEWADNAGVNRSMDDPQQTAYANDIVTKSNINTTSGVIIVQGNAVVAGQQATITAPSGATADTDNEARAKINDIRALLAAHGLMA